MKPALLRPVLVESKQQSRPDPALATALKRAVAEAITARPVTALVVWELPDGSLDWKAIPGSHHLVVGMVGRLAEVLSIGE